MDKFGSAVILAGGKSSRMGFDKTKLKFGGRYIIDIIAEQLSARFDQIIISANEPVGSDIDAREYCGDLHKGAGPLAGIYAGLREARSESVYFTACDMPEVSLDYIDLMIRETASSGAEICVAETPSGIEPFNAFYSVKLLPLLARKLESGELGLRRFIATANSRIIKFDAVAKESSGGFFTNLNTPHDVEEFNADLKGQL